MNRTFGEGQLVRRGARRRTVFNLSLYFASRLAIRIGNLRRGNAFCQFAAESVEILALREDGLAGFSGRSGACGVNPRQVQHRARLDPIDVAADESVGIAAEQRDQHLVE